MFINTFSNDRRIKALDTDADDIELNSQINNILSNFRLNSSYKLNMVEYFKKDGNMFFPYIEEIVGIAENNSSDRNKTVILGILYGINLNEAINLVKKYCNNIDELEDEHFSKNEKRSVEMLKTIKKIVQLDEDQLRELQANPKFIDFLEKASQNPNIDLTQIEDCMEQIYRRAFNKTLFKTKNGKKGKDLYYDTSKIETIEIPPDDEYFEFAAFVRVEGAYVPNWEAPDDYNDVFAKVNVKFHGNCESYITQSMLGVARMSKGPIFGYDSMNEKILVCAPWDIASSVQKDKITGSKNNKWYYRRGIRYDTPQSFINGTRQPHNEFVTERFNEDNSDITYDRKPAYVILFKDSSDEDLSVFEDENFKKLSDAEQLRLADKKAQYDETKKAASQLNIPIVIIDREKFAFQELKRIDEKLSAFEDAIRNGNPIPADKKKEMMKEIITSFENNSMGEFFSSKTYFTDDKRKSIISKLKDTLSQLPKEDYHEGLRALQEIIFEEKEKYYTSPGYYIDFEPSWLTEEYTKIQEELDKNGKNDQSESYDSSPLYSVLRRLDYAALEKIKYEEILMANSNLRLFSKALNMGPNEIKIAQAAIIAMNMPEDEITSENLERILGPEYKDSISDFGLIVELTEYIKDKLYFIQRTNGILQPNQLVSRAAYTAHLPEQYTKLGNLICDCVLLSNKLVGSELKDENFSYMVFDNIHNPLIIDNARKINKKIAKETLKINMEPDEFDKLDEKKYVETKAKGKNFKKLSVDECIAAIEATELSPTVIRPMDRSSQKIDAMTIMSDYLETNGFESVDR